MNEREAFFDAVDVSRETRARLDLYAALLEKWNPSINLVSRSTIPKTWQRHFLDSAQLLEVSGPEVKTWADLGTGGGFPGLIVAIIAAEKRPALRVTCIESDGRKAAFLRTVVRETGVEADVIARRAEDISPLGVEIVSARALAPLDTLIGFAEAHLRPGGAALFPKGAGYAGEVKQALETWSFELDTYQSKTDPSAAILKLGDIRRV